MNTSPEEIMRAIRASATKREAAEVLGVTAGRISGLIHNRPGDGALAKAWSELPAGGAFAGCSADVPRSSAAQGQADALVAEAVADWPIEITWNQRECVVNLLLAMFNITGSMAFPRGWVRAVMLAFDAAGHPSRPTPASLRWYRQKLRSEPTLFAGTWGADPGLIQDLVDRAGAE